MAREVFDCSLVGVDWYRLVVVQTARGKRKESDGTESPGMEEEEEEGSAPKPHPPGVDEQEEEDKEEDSAPKPHPPGDTGALSDSSDEDLPNVRTLKGVLKQRAAKEGDEPACSPVAEPGDGSSDDEQEQPSATKRAAATGSEEEGGTKQQFGWPGPFLS